jgi:hypothetical protein
LQRTKLSILLHGQKYAKPTGRVTNSKYLLIKNRLGCGSC